MKKVRFAIVGLVMGATVFGAVGPASAGGRAGGTLGGSFRFHYHCRCA